MTKDEALASIAYRAEQLNHIIDEIREATSRIYNDMEGLTTEQKYNIIRIINLCDEKP